MHDENSLIIRLKTLVQEAVESEFSGNSDHVFLEYPNEQAHGDYACNIALRLTKQVGISPREIAEKVMTALPKNDLIEKTEIAGPGFINFFISRKYLEQEVQEVLTKKNEYGKSELGKGKKVICEYSSPNIAKPLGVHHLLSTIIGQSIANIYNFLGFETISINHIGDWGTQFGKLIYAYKKWGNREEIEKDPIAELLKLYVKFHDEAEKDPSLEDEGRKEFKKFEDGNEENRELWQWFVDESLKEINKTYKKIGGIHFDYTLGESFYEDKMESILKEGKEKGVFVEGEEGAYIVQYEDENMAPLVVQKKDGATLYATRDLATLKYRIQRWSPEKIIYMVDIAQTLYFKQLFQAAERFPWYTDQGFHAWFGRMRMKDGKMSTRKGNVILLNEVLEEAITRASKLNENVAEAVGIGAIKYNILSQNRTTDITFDWDRMLSLEGNSSPYLQYSYARARSILRKSNEDVEKTTKDSEDTETKIHSLIRLFPKFQEQVIVAAEDYKPNILSNYLYDLAQKFNTFYNGVSVLRAERKEDREQRLKIVEAASQILKNGLALLGVEVVEEM